MPPKHLILLTLVAAVFAVFFYRHERHTSPSDDVRSIVRAYQGPQAAWPAPQLVEGVPYRPLAPLPAPPYPAGNPYTRSKEELGQKLFFDPRLSASGSIACASCHDPDLGWSDGRQRSFGHARRRGQRNSMTILNVAYYDHLFWDGRAGSLEDQALTALQSPTEMNMGVDAASQRIADVEAYKRLFEKSFGDPRISARRIARALATFQRGITSRTSAVDRFLQGDRAALTDRQVYGLHLFRTKAGCMNCHSGALLSDNKFHNIGQSHLGRPTEDLGRFLVTGDTADVGAFRTPSLRDVMHTAPYLHHGLIFSLREVIDMYDQGMPQIIPKKAEDHPLLPEKSPLVKPLQLTKEEKDALLAFLEALSTRPRRISAPDLPGVQGPSG